MLPLKQSDQGCFLSFPYCAQKRVCFGRLSGKEIKKPGYSVKGRRLDLPHGKQSCFSEDLIPKSSCMYFSLPSVCALIRRDMGTISRMLLLCVIPCFLMVYNKKMEGGD